MPLAAKYIKPFTVYKFHRILGKIGITALGIPVIPVIPGISGISVIPC
jgi:hypothetical protein